MDTTRTPGITVLADGRRFIDKRYLGIRIGLRVGAINQEQAEERLHIEIARVQGDLARKAHARPTFTDCAARYVAQSRSKRSIDTIKGHVTLLQSYLGYLEPRQIHDTTLEPFVKARLAGGFLVTDQPHAFGARVIEFKPLAPLDTRFGMNGVGRGFDHAEMILQNQCPDPATDGLGH